MRFETRAIHDGQPVDPLTGAVVVPVYQASTFQQEAVGKHKGYEYSRTGNPTRQALEICLASLEEGKFGLAFSSGVAATTAVFNLLKKGDHIIAGDDIYGGTYRLLERVFKKWGISVTYADVDNANSFKKGVTKRTKLIWIETPTNPLLKIIDIEKISKIARKNNIIFAVDNTFASPYFQRPLLLGADIVVHSTTKYIAGHSDIIGGAVIVNDTKLYNDLKFYQNAAGAVPGAWDCWLVLRGIKTLPIRMRAHEENALFLTKFLAGHKKVDQVYYPGLKTSKGYQIAKKQMTGFSGMVSIKLKGDFGSLERFISKLKIFSLAESLGGVESLICYPARMTHGAILKKERIKRGITDNFIRLSVGIENKIDLRNDLAQALASK
ncbi:PLP-dependent transferase [bacterium]|nr:MAG: PLP-dependent transferase [bacterium]